MRAAVFRAAHEPLSVEEVLIDEPREGEVLIRTVASGVCHSDLHFTDGVLSTETPAVLGHEGAGVVEAVGPGVTYVEPGDHVVACLSSFCGRCERCLIGRPNLCEARPVRDPSLPPRLSRPDGGAMHQSGSLLSTFAEQMLVHERNLVKITKEIPLDRACLLGCGVTTGMGAVLNTAKVRPGSTVAVFGAGGVGLSAVQGARIAGARMIIAVDTLASKEGWAREVGATHFVDASASDPVEAIRELTGGGADYTFEAIGIAAVAEQAYEAVRAGGQATVIGVIPAGHKIQIEGSTLLREKKLTGSSMGSNRFRLDIPVYADLYLQGRLLLDEMITRRGPLDEINEMFDALHRGEVLRQVVVFDEA